MTLTSSPYASSVNLPSIGAISYQALYLIDSLERMSEREYPANTIRLRDVFLSIAKHVRDELEDLHDPENPVLPKKNLESVYKVLGLAVVIRKLFAMKRYLDASLPAKTPPGIQAALHQLARFVVPHKKDLPLIVVRPQWLYNLTYVAIDLELEKILATSLVSTENAISPRQHLENIYRSWREKTLSEVPGGKEPRKKAEIDKAFPAKMGILSFAALDTPDSLLSPLLAHELGHFIDFTNEPQPLHRSADVVQISLEALRAFEQGAIATSPRLVASWEFLKLLTFTCLREILADFLALRMMGLSYFIALAEFLKTLVEDSDGVITDSGYPSMKFRLWLLFEQLKNDSARNNLFDFLKGQKDRGRDTFARETSEKLLNYLSDWEKELCSSHIPRKFEKRKGVKKEIYYVQQAVWESLPELVKIAKGKISNRRRAVLTPHFFGRVRRLTEGRPPTISEEHRESFHEICSAAWVFQIMHGDPKEGRMESIEARRAEYDRTCQLVMKAIDRIPE